MESFSPSYFRVPIVAGLLALTAGMSDRRSTAQELSEDRTVAWTRAEALQQLEYYPRDPFLQFVVTQLSTTPQEAAQAKRYLPQPPSQPQIAWQRNQQVNLYSIFSGSLAVQESLQLDAMIGNDLAETGEPTVSLKELRGPTVRSHPWAEMLGGRSPEVSRVAECVPEDHLLIRANSISKLLELRGRIDDWYAYAQGQSSGRRRSAGAIDRVQRQWLLETSDYLKPIYDVAVAEAAITSSDLFFSEGTDATLILRLNQPETIRPTLDQTLKAAAKQDPRATLSSGSLLGVPYQHVATPDREIHVFAADVGEDLHIRSNSRAAFERILRTALNQPGEHGNTPAPLSATDEFRYIRTLMPSGAEEEDVLVYLSDPFIRNLIGAEKKLTQRNRLVCRGRLQLLRHAQLLYRTQHGREATSIEQLRAGDCLGNSQAAMELTCPSDGSYSLEPTDMSAHCSHHGSLDAMVPCGEIPVGRVSRSQAEEYRRFVEEYSRYWQTFFDPIAVRIRLEPERTRIETIVLPLINNSIYTGLAAALGGPPELLDSLPIPRSNIATLAVKLDKSSIFKQLGIPREQRDTASEEKQDQVAQSAAPFPAGRMGGAMRRIGLALHNHHDAYKRLPPRPETGRGIHPESKLSWRVQILPFLGEQELYGQFRLDEPWDSEHNRELIDKMPEIFASGNKQLDREGKTRIVFPRHPDALHQDLEGGPRFRDVTDGLSNTIALVIADEDRAVTWTRPEDLKIDRGAPRRGWSEGVDGLVNALLADGAVVAVPAHAPDDLVTEYLTRAGGETSDTRLPLASVDRLPQRRGADRGPANARHYGPTRLIEELSLAEFLHRGIGNQVAIHICDQEPLVDLNVSQLGGLLLGTMTRRTGSPSPEAAIPGLLAVAVNSPVYVSVPVEDRKIVDQTLEKLDRYLVRLSRASSQRLGGFLRIEQDSYKFSGNSDPSIRAYAFQFGPVKWRFFWMRAGDGLYIASKPGLIGQLRAAVQRAERQESPAAKSPGAAHAMVRLRPHHWKQVKPHYRIGWAETERHVCLNNLAPLSHAGRAIIRDRNVRHMNARMGGPASESTGDQNAKFFDELGAFTKRLFGGPMICPSHGAYQLDEQSGIVSCTVHGTATEPRQPPANGRGRIARVPESLADLRMELTFLEDGLHSVVVIENQGETRKSSP